MNGADRPPALVFTAALIIYLLTWRAHHRTWAGMFEPDPQHHAVLQAEAWLHGRLDLDCQLDTLDVTPFNDRAHSAFPPANALFLLPFVSLLGRDTPVLLLQCVVGALGVLAVHRMLLAAQSRFSLPAGRATIDALTALYALGTMTWITVAQRGIYPWAHHLTLVALSAAIAAALRRRAGWAGALWALAIAARPTALGAAPLLLYLCRRNGVAAAPRRLLALSAAPLVALAAMAALNTLRFGSPLDSGYSRMNVLPQLAGDLAQYGVLNPCFIPRNAYTFFLKPPIREPKTGVWRSDYDGMAVWFITPAFLLLVRAGWRDPWKRAVWASVALTLAPLLMYYTTGFSQWGCRFLLDVHPELMLLLLPALGARPSRLALALILASVALTTVAVWQLHLHWYL